MWESEWDWDMVRIVEGREATGVWESGPLVLAGEDDLDGGGSLGTVGRGLLFEARRNARELSRELDEFRDEERVAICGWWVRLVVTV